MHRNKWLATTTGAIAIVMATMGVAWACGNFTTADMTLKNADAPDKDQNWNECMPSKFLATPHTCGRAVKVNGTNFQNDIDIKTVTAVTLYWLDEPFYAAGLGGPNGTAEQTESEICRTQGVYLTTATVTNKTFAATVTVPPTNNTTEGGTTAQGDYVPPTYRPGAGPTSAPNSGKYYYGKNAICAVWAHTTAGGLMHYGSVGNTYDLYLF